MTYSAITDHTNALLTAAQTTDYSEQDVADLQKQASAHLTHGTPELALRLQELFRALEKLRASGAPEKKAKALTLVALVLLYVISPLDAVPDVLPFIGWLDDLTAVAAVLSQIKSLVK